MTTNREGTPSRESVQSIQPFIPGERTTVRI
jgi:hypothetical protein